MRTSLRRKADRASQMRCRTLACVLENPGNAGNVASVMRNVDCLGVGRLYIVTDQPFPHDRTLLHQSASASKWVYTRCFPTTRACLDHLARLNYRSVVTSPHTKGRTNALLGEYAGFTAHHLAVWFGNETDGASDEAIAAADACINLTMRGIVESMNLATTTGIVLHHVVERRMAWCRERGRPEK